VDHWDRRYWLYSFSPRAGRLGERTGITCPDVKLNGHLSMTWARNSPGCAGMLSQLEDIMCLSSQTIGRKLLARGA
jgi:hypothetical protein